MTTSTRSATFSFLRSSYPWIIVACGMLFYCFNYFLRVSPSIMQNELSQAFHITATELGTLASFYYFAYTSMQIPAGMLYDKFGVRFVLCLACLTSVIGLAAFIAADSYLTAGAGRFMIGLGTAFAYIGTLKLASIWLPTNRFATIAGITTAIGMIAGALSQKYLVTLVEVVGYKEALRSALFAGIALSVIIVLLVRNQSKNFNITTNELQTSLNIKQSFRALGVILRNPQMWLIGLIGSLLYFPSSVFLDLWGIPYLKTVYSLNSEQTVTISSYTFYGWIISGPIIGAISDKIKRRRMPLTIIGFFAALLLCIVFYMPDMSLSNLNLIFFMIGVCCGAQSL
jgi:sugar phosphate permease